jgi:hypothetical protein
VKAFKITEANDGMLRVTVEGEDPFYVKPSEGLSREEAIDETANLVMSRNTRKHLNMLSDSLAIADELLSELASERAAAPPAIAEALISLFTPKRFSDAQLGDMQEIFEANVKRYGPKRANPPKERRA